MEEKEITYIPYGQDEISQQDLMTNIANETPNFIKRYKWLQKPEIAQKFVDAVKDISTHGITGASSDSGVWEISHGGDKIDLDTKSPLDRKIYEMAAFHIQQQMALTPTKKKEEEKKTKTPFNFLDSFKKRLLREYGGNESLFADPETGWASLDERGENGLRGIEKRRDTLKAIFEDYLKNYKDGENNFEGTSFTDDNDVRTKLQNAINALGTTDTTTDDVAAFNALGIPYKALFSNGGNDIYGVNEEGKQITYQQYADYYNKINEQKEKEELIKKYNLENANKGVLTYSINNNPIDAVHNTKVYNNWITQKYNPQNGGMQAFDNRVQQLLEKSYNNGSGNGLTSQERKELGNMIHYIRANNPKYQQYNLTPEDEGYLNAQDFPKLKGRRLQDFVRLPYQTSDGRYTYADKSGNIYFLKPKNQAKLTTAPTFDKNRIQEYNNYIKGFGKNQLEINNETPVLSQDTDILISDITSMLGDIVSLGGGIAGAAGGITTILSDLYGDIRRGKDTWGVIKNLGANIAWGAAGLIPGAKLGKVAKNAARIYAILQSAGILRDPEVQKSWKNLIDGKDITAGDFENFKWTLHAITGGTNAVRGHLTERNVNKQIKTNNKPTIETQSGNKPITQEQVRKINRIGGRKGQKAAEEAFEKEVGAKPKEGTFTFQEESRSGFNPLRYSQRLRNWIGDDERLTLSKTNSSINQQKVNELLELDRSKPLIGIGNPFGRKFWTEGGPNRGGLSFYLKPYANQGTPKQEPTSNNETPSNPQSTTAQIESKIPHSKNEIRRDWKNTIERKQFTTNEIKAGDYIITNPKDSKYNVNFNVSEKDSEGFRTLTINGSNPIKIKTQQQLQERIAKAMQSYRTTVNNSTAKAGMNHKEVGKILRDLKARGWLKHGGNINPSLDKIIEDFIKNNNICI